MRRTDRIRKLASTAAAVCVIVPACLAGEQPGGAKANVFATRREAAAMLVGCFERMCAPKSLVARTGLAFRARQKDLRAALLKCASLSPLPKRPPLDPHLSRPLDHEWCTVRRVHYQIWPNVYSNGLLYMPKRFPERPAPAVLCPHGHWRQGSANPEVQRRCLVLAGMGYVVFSPSQLHYEDPALGISHQTVMIWSNIRALDYLEGLPEVDRERIGCAGCSGGGLQTQMLVAVDPRIKAATICGMTCEYREILFPGRAHCGCNHFPNIMRYTDGPEISALGLPTAVQYLTMNDWTRRFRESNYREIRRLYEANGLKDHTDCRYWPTQHSYDRPKRERTYWWMEKWLRGKDHGGAVVEPATKTLGVDTLLELKADVPRNKGLAHISRLFAEKLRYRAPKIGTRGQWQRYRRRMRQRLAGLLGGPDAQPRGQERTVGTKQIDGLVVERVLYPSEAGVLVPTVILRSAGAKDRRPAVVICDDRGKAAVLSAGGPDSPAARAKQGAVVVVPDVRFVGELSLRRLAGLTGDLRKFRPASPMGEGKPESFEAVWQRNAMLWGRPLLGMSATDIRAVLACVARRTDVSSGAVTLEARGAIAVAALFAAAESPGVKTLRVDLDSKCFAKRNLPLVPFVLRHGDVLQWAAVLADRRLRLAGVPKEAGDPRWLQAVFKAAGGAGALQWTPPRSQAK